MFTTGVDGIAGSPVWLHFWTPPWYNMEAFIEDVAEQGHLQELQHLLQRDPPTDLLECSIVHAAIGAPMFIRWAAEEPPGLWQRESAQEAAWQERFFLLAAAAYEQGHLVAGRSRERAAEMYRRAAALGSRAAAEWLNPATSILGLL